MMALWRNFWARSIRPERAVQLGALGVGWAAPGRRHSRQALGKRRVLVLALLRMVQRVQVLVAQQRAVRAVELVVKPVRERVPVLAQAGVRLLLVPQALACASLLRCLAPVLLSVRQQLPCREPWIQALHFAALAHPS